MRDAIVLPDLLADDARASVSAGLAEFARQEPKPEIAIILTAAGMSRLRERFPFLEPPIQRLLERRGHKALYGMGERFMQRLMAERANAFRVTSLRPTGEPLVTDLGSQRLGVQSGVRAQLMSLLCIEGAVHASLARDGGTVFERELQPGELIHYRGELTCSLASAAAGGDGAGDGADADVDTRPLVLTCEQYALGEVDLERVEIFSLRASSRFAASLEEARQKPTRQFELD